MTADSRNTAVVIALIVSMTAGARVLDWLVPRPAPDPIATLLAARSGPRVESLVVEYRTPPIAVEAYDCVIPPDGASPVWQPTSEHLRLVVLGDGAAELNTEQARTLLAVIHGLCQTQGLRLANVALSPDSDPQQRADLPPQARALADLLVRKELIR